MPDRAQCQPLRTSADSASDACHTRDLEGQAAHPLQSAYVRLRGSQFTRDPNSRYAYSIESSSTRSIPGLDRLSERHAQYAVETTNQPAAASSRYTTSCPCREVMWLATAVNICSSAGGIRMPGCCSRHEGVRCCQRWTGVEVRV